jgi:hypothetical protein
VEVRQAVALTVRRSGGTVVADVQVAPGGPTPVVLQVLRSTGWATIATATTGSTGAVRFTKALKTSRLRVVATARPALLAGTSPVRLV